MLPKILITTQPRFPLPASVNGGSSATIIENTLATLPIYVNAWALSLVDTPFQNIHAITYRNHVVIRSSLLFRLARRFAAWHLSKQLAGLQGRNKDYITALYLDVLVYKPKILVVHTTKLEWAVRIKRCFSSQKVVAYIHHSESHLEETGLLTKALSLLDGFIFVCNYARDCFQKRAEELGFVDVVTYTIYNGVDTQTFSPDPEKRQQVQQKLGLSGEKCVLLYCGRLIPRKGIHKLLEAIAMLAPNVREQIFLVIAGGTDYNSNEPSAYIESLHHHAHYLLPNSVRFLGYVSHEEMPGIIAACDILILPSIESEGFPLVLLEAQSAGIPVIASKVGGIPEAIIPGKTGFLIDPPGDSDQIAQYISAYVQNRVLIQSMGMIARQHVISHFSSQHLANQFITFINVFCSRKLWL